jgi:excisionase family DNA binding protein
VALYRWRVKESNHPAPPAVAVISDLDALADALAERLGASTATSNVGQEPYWTAEQAAAYIAADKQRIYDLRSQGRLRCVKDGSRLLTRRSWLDAYLEGVG